MADRSKLELSGQPSPDGSDVVQMINSTVSTALAPFRILVEVSKVELEVHTYESTFSWHLALLPVDEEAKGKMFRLTYTIPHSRSGLDLYRHTLFVGECGSALHLPRPTTPAQGAHLVHMGLSLIQEWIVVNETGTPEKEARIKTRAMLTELLRKQA
jgi:hypothetical protein